MLEAFLSSVVWVNKSEIASGILLTLEIFVPVAVASLLAGTLLAVARQARAALIGDLANHYVTFFRNVPAIVKMFFLYFALNLNAYESAVIGLTLHHAAYIAEVVQAGMNSSSAALKKVALASGFSEAQAIRFVVLPVAFRYIIPPLTTQFIQVLKNTAVAMVITVPELTFVLSTLNEDTFKSVELAITGTAVYATLAAVIVAVMARVERRYHPNF